ncbi:MAG: hypothetical protein GXO23_07855 [Crenarchaeota archaeon]|nr:hypothetical protein [Thermoproteota archaeon]
MPPVDVERLALSLSSGIILEPLALIKPGNTSRMYDTHINLRDFVYGCTSIILTVKQCIEDSMRGKIMFGYYIYRTLELCKSLVNENTCAGTTLMIIPLSVAVGYLLSNDLPKDVKYVTYMATKLLREHSTCNDTIMFYRALRLFNISYVRNRNFVPSLPSVYDDNYHYYIIRDGLNLWKLLKYCSHIDICSRQVITFYEDVLEMLRYFKMELLKNGNLDYTILLTYYRTLLKVGDTMVLREHSYSAFKMLRDEARRLYELCIKDPSSCLHESEIFHNKLVKAGINPGSVADLVAVMLSLWKLEHQLSMM